MSETPGAALGAGARIESEERQAPDAGRRPDPGSGDRREGEPFAGTTSTTAPSEGSSAGLAGLLATAVQRHRLYPPESPLCAEALAQVVAHLTRLPGGALEIRVEPEGITCDGDRPASTALVRELGERLFRADIALVTLQSDATLAELGRFCRIVGLWDRRGDRDESVADRLIDEGAVGVRVKMVERIGVIDAAVLTSPELEALERDRSVRAPGDRVASSESLGFVRVDTDSFPEPLDLVDLAFLHEDPGDLAVAIEHALEGPLEEVDRDGALFGRIGDLITLYGRLGPDASARRLDALATAVHELDPKARGRLLGEKLLPELLETGRSAALLRRLPDEVLEAALRDDASGGLGLRGVAELALARLDLPEARMDALRRRLGLTSTGSDESARDGGEARVAGRIVVGAGGPEAESLARYAAVDLALDEEAIGDLRRVREAVTARGEDELRLQLLVDLIPLVRNADALEELAGAGNSLLGQLCSTRPTAATSCIREWVGRAESLRETFPEAAAAMDRTLSPLVEPAELSARAADLAEDTELAELIRSFGPHAAGAFVEALQMEDVRATRRTLSDFMCTHADRLADGLVAYIGDPRWMVRRNVARALGFAGASYTPFLRALLDTDEERVAREALLALARIGTEEAADAVTELMRAANDTLAAMAADSLKRFPRGIARTRARAILSDPGFYGRHPGPAAELVRRLLRRDPRSVELLTGLSGLRFRLWRPASARLGWTAWRVLRSARTAR